MLFYNLRNIRKVPLSKQENHMPCKETERNLNKTSFFFTSAQKHLERNSEEYLHKCKINLYLLKYLSNLKDSVHMSCSSYANQLHFELLCDVFEVKP